MLTELLSRDALKPYANLPADGAAMKGQVDGHLTVATRFGDHVPHDETKIGVSATAANFGIDKLIGKEGLSDATLKLDVDKTGLHAKGDGRIYGAPATWISGSRRPAAAKPPSPWCSTTPHGLGPGSARVSGSRAAWPRRSRPR